jgi:hypothetical protein
MSSFELLIATLVVVAFLTGGAGLLCSILFRVVLDRGEDAHESREDAPREPRRSSRRVA